MPQESDSRSLDKVIVRLPDGMRDRLKEKAELHKRSMNAEIVDRLDRSFYENTEANFLDTLIASDFTSPLPPGLAGRIQDAAVGSGRSVEEEVVQALERAFPAPQPFSLDWFNEEWIARILVAPPSERLALVARANEVLMQNGGKYEVWLGDGDGDDEGSVVLGRRLVREEKRAPASADLERDVLSLIAVMEEEVHNKNFDTPPPSLQTELGNRLGGIISSRTELAAVTVVERLQDAGLLKKPKAGEASDATEAAPHLRRLA